ncbi:hypothetical protein ACJIZ3_022394 [Penstemon smallii]|uniref:Uncharacterized protein n=1 Tax=Penstemon smallii TaxID=265156 RepID=A0ABD3TMY6_9LAMI
MANNRKRKPLADITNTFNLIPTSTLRKLVDSSSSNSKPILRSNSSSTTQKVCSDSENRSETSIGSSNISTNRSSRTVQFRTPSRPISKSNVGSKDAAHNRTNNIEKSKEIEAGVVNVSSTSVEKRKDKGKAIAIPSSPLHFTKVSDNENAIDDPCCSWGRTKQKDKVNLSLFGGLVEKGNPSSCSYEKTEKGKEILKFSGCSTGKIEDIGKGIDKDSSCSLENTINVKKGILKRPGSSIERSRDGGKDILTSSSSLSERSKERGNALSLSVSSNGKSKEKGKAILDSPDIVEISKHVNGAVNCPRPRNKSERSKNVAGASSCLPKLRTKNIQ